jgi:predicted nucleotidyltransferase
LNATLRMESPAERSIQDFVGPAEAAALAWLIERVLTEISAELMEAALFGSVARCEATPESDLDVLLIFRDLPPDREPQASHAEAIAEEIAAESGVPVTVWSVSLADLEEGNRTPMLVDALSDSVPIWVWGRPVPILPFTPADGIRCARSLLARVAEGSAHFREALAGGEWTEAARRARDDTVRLCTAWLLLHGITRPRRADAVREFARLALSNDPVAYAELDEVLRWAAASFGPTGRTEDLEFGFPPTGPVGVSRAIDLLRAMVKHRGDLVYQRWRGVDDEVRGAPLLHP